MNLFQLLALGVVGCLLVVTVVAAVKGWTTRGGGLAWGLVWVAAGVVIVDPDLTFVFSKRLGLSKGADLVVYGAVLAMLVGFFMVYARLHRLRRDLTLLARHLAIQNAIEGVKPVQPDRG